MRHWRLRILPLLALPTVLFGLILLTYQQLHGAQAAGARWRGIAVMAILVLVLVPIVRRIERREKSGSPM